MSTQDMTVRGQVPPVFGIVRLVLGSRQFLPHGRNRVWDEWSLVTMAWNIKRVLALCSAQ